MKSVIVRLQPTPSIITNAKPVDSNLVDFDRKTCLGHPGILHSNSFHILPAVQKRQVLMFRR